MFDFRRAKVFDLGHRFSKHKMTGYAKNWVLTRPMSACRIKCVLCQHTLARKCEYDVVV